MRRRDCCVSLTHCAARCTFLVNWNIRLVAALLVPRVRIKGGGTLSGGTHLCRPYHSQLSLPVSLLPQVDSYLPASGIFQQRASALFTLPTSIALLPSLPKKIPLLPNCFSTIYINYILKYFSLYYKKEFEFWYNICFSEYNHAHVYKTWNFNSKWHLDKLNIMLDIHRNCFRISHVICEEIGFRVEMWRVYYKLHALISNGYCLEMDKSSKS